MGKKVLRVILAIIAAVFTLAFLALSTVHGVLYDTDFFLGIPSSDYINTLTEQVQETLAKDARFYGIEPEAIKAMVNRADIDNSVHLYYRNLAKAVTDPAARMDYVEFPYTGYDTALREYFSGIYDEDELNGEAIREIAIEFAETTEDSIMLINPDTINTLTRRFTANTILEKISSLHLICGAVAAVCAILIIVIPDKKASKASRVSFAAASVFLPAAFFFVMSILFRAYDFKGKLILSNGVLKLFANAIIDRLMDLMVTISGFTMLAAGIILLIALIVRVAKRSKMYQSTKHHISHRFTRSTAKLVTPYILVTAAMVLLGIFAYRYTVQTGMVQAFAATTEQYGTSSSSADHVELPIVIDETASAEAEKPTSQFELPVIYYRSQWATVNVDGWRHRDIPVYFADVKDDEALNLGAITPGYSEFCGVGGRCTMAAHVTSDFEEIEETEVGTRVHVATTYGVYEYVVDEVVVFEQEDNSYIYPNRDREELVMYTCWPLNNNLAPRVHRIALICHLEDDSDFLAALAEEHKGEENEPLEDSDVIEPSSGETANN